MIKVECFSHSSLIFVASDTKRIKILKSIQNEARSEHFVRRQRWRLMIRNRLITRGIFPLGVTNLFFIAHIYLWISLKKSAIEIRKNIQQCAINYQKFS